MWFAIVIGVLTGYLLGNLNGAVSISTLMKDDVRSHGSGNAGLTNFIRNYGNTKALYVVAVDAIKAILSCLLTGLLLKPYGMYLEGVMIGGAAVMAGHVFPVLLGFRGGKGILSGLFIAAVADWRIALGIAVIFFAVYFITRYVSLSSILAAVGFGIGFCVLHHDNTVVMILGLVMPVLTIFMHRSNIARLLSGKETKTDLFKKDKSV
ncbi:MAG: glycerol-3-phosphate acyltransferase [Oscillospiraceae bacterium]|nr:glycerol-3-phosphate acyltransferase [Oscillospiraceae bacterium]